MSGHEKWSLTCAEERVVQWVLDTGWMGGGKDRGGTEGAITKKTEGGREVSLSFSVSFSLPSSHSLSYSLSVTVSLCFLSLSLEVFLRPKKPSQVA